MLPEWSMAGKGGGREKKLERENRSEQKSYLANGSSANLQFRHNVFNVGDRGSILFFKELPMTLLSRLSYVLLFILTAYGATAASAAEEEKSAEKVVRLIWFPRFSPDGKWLLTAHG